MIEEKRYLPVGCVGFQVCLTLLYSLSLLLCMIYCLILFFYLLGSQNYISLAGGVAVTENIILS